MSVSRRLAGRVVVIAGVLGLSLITAARAVVWTSDLTLWTDAVAKAPEKPRPLMNLGRALELTGQRAAAEAAYRQVIWRSFDDRRSAYVRRFSLAAAETNLAHLAMTDGHLATAMQILDTTLAQWPEFPYAHYNKGAILWVVGACDAAQQEYLQALSADPTLAGPKGTCTPATP